jgi:hypothetical protein
MSSLVGCLKAGILLTVVSCSGGPLLGGRVFSAETAPRAACVASAYHEFDFWVGDWTHSRSLALRQSHASEWTSFLMAASCAKTIRAPMDTKGRVSASTTPQEKSGIRVGSRIEASCLSSKATGKVVRWF